MNHPSLEKVVGQVVEKLRLLPPTCDWTSGTIAGWIRAAVEKLTRADKERIQELETALGQFKDAWDKATYTWDGMSLASANDLEAASELAGQVLAKKT